MNITKLRYGYISALAGLLLMCFMAGTALAQDEPKDATEQQETIALNEDDKSFTFSTAPEGMELEQVIKMFSEVTGKNFLIEEMPKGKVIIIAPKRFEKEEALNIFYAILNINGFNLVETAVPSTYKIVRNAEVMQENLPIFPSGRRPATSETFITRFVPLKHLAVTDVQSQVQTLLSKEGGSVIAYEPTNTLIFFDTSLNIERIVKLLRLIDIPTEKPEIEIIKLKYSLASEISATLNQIFGNGKQKTGASRTAQTTRSRSSRGQPKVEPAAQITSRGSQVNIIPEERLNALILIGTKAAINEVKDLIGMLDIDVGESGKIHVYYLEHADAPDLASTLSSLTGSSRTGSRQTATSSRSTSSGARQAATSRVSSRAATGHSGAISLTGILSGEVRISADEPTNSLIIVASRQDYEVLKQVIAKLDIPRRQVFVEAVLLEVNMNDGVDSGMSFHGASGLEDGGAVFGGTGLTTPSSMDLMAALMAGSFAMPSGVTVGALGQGVEIPGTGVELPSAGVLLRLLATNSNVNILSTPTLLTTDNEEAEIQIGQKIPVPTGQTVSTGGLSSVSISRESVGIKLKLTPQINESDTIRLEIFTEISGALQSSLGIDVNVLGVTTSIKTAQTTVIVENEQTIVIGGLMEEQTNSSGNQIPFFGDIPVLGWLFKNRSKSTSKTNLIILITPHIVKNDADVTRIKNHIRKEYEGFAEENIENYHKWDEKLEPKYTLEDPQNGILDFTGTNAQIIESNDDEGISLPTGEVYNTQQDTPEQILEQPETGKDGQQ